jgi:2-dehydropantoate 2-reductase
MSKTIKSVCVYGIGGVGGYFGGRIAHEISKSNRAIQVYFIGRGEHLKAIQQHGLGRGEHLKAIQQHGLNLITDKKEFLCFPHIATDNIRHIPTPDLYLLCVKGYDLDNAVVSISKNISADTIILPLLNGVDICECIRTSLQKAIVLPASVYVTIRQVGPEGHIVFGKDPKHLNYNYKHLIEFFNEMGISSTWHDNPYPAIWEKYIFITAFSLMTAYSGKTIGAVLSDDKLKSMTENIMKEVILVGKAKNIDFEQDVVEKTLQKAKDFPYETKTKKGKPDMKEIY